MSLFDQHETELFDRYNGEEKEFMEPSRNPWTDIIQNASESELDEYVAYMSNQPVRDGREICDFLNDL